MLIPGLILLLVGLVLWYATVGIVSLLGLICAVIGAVLLIVAAVQLASARSRV